MKKFRKQYNKFKFKKLKIKLKNINYKNIKLLKNYITFSGKIIPKRLNKLTTKQQRYMTKAIKNARIVSFLPFVRLVTL